MRCILLSDEISVSLTYPWGKPDRSWYSIGCVPAYEHVMRGIMSLLRYIRAD